MENTIINRVADLPGVEGCAQEEIQSLEAILGMSLPATYRAFLSAVGKNAGALMHGSDLVAARLPRLQQAARELLEESSVEWRLEERDFVFLMHQGYEFLFLRIDGSDDPPVHLYIEEDVAPTLIAPSFSAWLALALAEVTGTDNGV